MPPQWRIQERGKGVRKYRARALPVIKTRGNPIQAFSAMVAVELLRTVN